LPLIALSAKWEQAFAESLIGQGEERSLAMQPSRLSEFMTVVRDRFEQAARDGEAPVLVTSAAIRPFVRSLVERFRAQTTVLSQGGNPSPRPAENRRQHLGVRFQHSHPFLSGHLCEW
jgi:flagellar biosynthesis protein FlhA